MKRVEMIIRPEKLETVKSIINDLKINGMSVTMVTGCGKQKGRLEVYRGVEFSINLLPKVKIETVVDDDKVDPLIDEVVKQVRTGEIGDGKIFVCNVEQAVRIRTGETGVKAL